MGPKASLDDLQGKNFLPLSEFAPHTVHPVAQKLYRLRYPDPHGRFMDTPNSRILLSSLLSRPTNAQHIYIYINNILYNVRTVVSIVDIHICVFSFLCICWSG